MRALIVGRGRAGKRHERILRKLGISVATVDPVEEATFKRLEDALDHPWDIGVVATPPKYHLEISLVLLRAGMRVMCEKPLCALYQPLPSSEEELADLKVAFNWRFHPLLRERVRGNRALISIQQRESLPPWGLLLDHVSHDVDILGPFLPVNAEEEEYGWRVWGVDEEGNSVMILDYAYPYPVRRETWVIGRDGARELVPFELMFTDMWVAFLRDDPRVATFEEALEVQRILERIYEAKRR